MATPRRTMTVTVRIAPTLRRRLAAFGEARSLDLGLPSGATVRQAAVALGLDPTTEALIAVVNGRVAPLEGELHDGDQLRLMHRLAGGRQPL